MRRALIALTALAAVTGAGLALPGVAPATTEPAPSTTAAPTATAEVERRDITQVERVAGVLGYAEERDLALASAGTLTWLPDAGALVRRGEPVASLDGQPVLLAHGSVPAWRDLQVGVRRGEDIRQLEENLVALGYAEASSSMPDDRYTWSTSQAVRAWQEATGARSTGTLALGSVVFVPADVRVLRQRLAVGQPVRPGEPVLQVAATAREVRAALGAAQSDLLAVGDRVVVELPDGRRLDGTVHDLGRGLEERPDGTVERPVRIRLEDAAAVDGVDVAPVTVEITSTRAEAVLAVPVHALRPHLGGGYVVDVVDGGSPTSVAVDVGAIAEGWAEVRPSGQGDLQAGDAVVVPA